MGRLFDRQVYLVEEVGSEGGRESARTTVAVDEFGVGNSTLAMLQRCPVDTIKIDRSFMRDLTSPGHDAVLADAIITMGKALSMTVVAQGVETKEQADFLRLHACDELQGFYFGQPLPPAEFAELLSDLPLDIAYEAECRA